MLTVQASPPSNPHRPRWHRSNTTVAEAPHQDRFSPILRTARSVTPSESMIDGIPAGDLIELRDRHARSRRANSRAAPSADRLTRCSRTAAEPHFPSCEEHLGEAESPDCSRTRRHLHLRRTRQSRRCSGDPPRTKAVSSMSVGGPGVPRSGQRGRIPRRRARNTPSPARRRGQVATRPERTGHHSSHRP